MQERQAEENQGKIAAAVESNHKRMADKLKHLNVEWIDKNARTAEKMAELNRACDEAGHRVQSQESKILEMSEAFKETRTTLTSNLNEFKYDFHEKSNEMTKQMEAIQNDFNLYEICKPEEEDGDEGQHPDAKAEI